MGAIPPSAILSRKGIARYGGVSRTGPLRSAEVVVVALVRVPNQGFVVAQCTCDLEVAQHWPQCSISETASQCCSPQARQRAAMASLLMSVALALGAAFSLSAAEDTSISIGACLSSVRFVEAHLP